MRKSVTYLRLHTQDTFVPGIGQSIGSTLPITKGGKEMKLFYDTETPNVVIIEVDGKEHFIPITNVQIGSFASSPAKK